MGTARSGTTLVQRLACSLEGVRVPPETHFRNFMKNAGAEARFPLDESALRDVLGRFGDRKAARGLVIDVEGIVADLGGTCPDPWRLFAALVRSLAGPAASRSSTSPA